MRYPLVAGIGTTWRRLVEGSDGWTALPRLTAWLCVPAVIAGAAAGIGQAAATIPPTTSPFSRAIAGSAGSVAVFFGMLGMLTSPLAALLVFVLSLRRRWRLRVVGMLWLLAIVAMAVTFPAIGTAMRTWMILERAHRVR